MASSLTDDLQEQIRLAPGKLIAGRIKRARKNSGLSHDRLAELCNTSRQHLIKLEQGRHKPRAQMLRSIAAATREPIQWFVDEELDPSPFPDELDGNG